MKYKARIQFYGKDMKGALYEPLPGYRPHLKVGDVLTSCFITPVDISIVKFRFNTTYDVFIELMFPEVYGAKLDLKLPIELYEGSRLIGGGHYVSE